MILEIHSAGVTRRVEVTRHGAGWTVILEGRPFHASLIAAGERWSLLVAERPGAGAGPGISADPGGDADTGAAARSYDVALAQTAPGDLVVYVEGRPVPVTVADPRTRSTARRAAPGAEYDGPRDVTTPMPGRIVKLLVEPGDIVMARQGVIVVEAMKMENELRAPKAGTVSAVHVREGATVEAGAALMTIE